MAKVSLLAI